MFFRVLVIGLGVLLLSSCGNTEKEARTLLNVAIKDWRDGHIVEAEKKFDTIEDHYLDTAAATAAIKERALLKEAYKSDIEELYAQRDRSGVFSRIVNASIDRFFKDNGTYPDTLNELDLDDYTEYLHLCEYNKAFFEFGYQLGCSDADKAFTDSRRASRNANQVVNSEHYEKEAGLAGFPKASSTWGKRFNPSRTTPEQGFYAYYFDSTNPNEMISHETVDDVSINYAWDEFHNIKSQDFGAYWVGRINLPKDEITTIAISQSWSKARIIIDGFVVFEGGSDQEILLGLEKGSHLLEVEYINNWHTTEFSVAFTDQVQKFTRTEIREKLASSVTQDYEIYYAGLYESASRDLSVVLHIEKSPRPIVLFLSSYSPVKWKISNPYMTDIRAIVFGAYSPGASVSGDINESTLLLPAEKRIGSYKTAKQCSCNAGIFHCEGTGILATKTILEQMSNQKLAGFSGEYAASELKVPQVTVSAQYLRDRENEDKEVAKRRELCRKQSNPNFENLFEEPH